MAFFDFMPKNKNRPASWILARRIPRIIFFAFFSPEMGSRINLDPKKLLVGGSETSPSYPLALGKFIEERRSVYLEVGGKGPFLG